MPYSDSLDTVCPEPVLNAWLNAITSLRLNYNQLSTCITKRQNRSISYLESSTDLGQCSNKQLLALQIRMELALKQLLEEMDQIEESEQSRSVWNIKKLENHTLRLNKLNKEAQTKFNLLAVALA
ncbi:hypothetical protein GCM10028805_63970 [Spirosoma harenae]